MSSPGAVRGCEGGKGKEEEIGGKGRLLRKVRKEKQEEKGSSEIRLD